MTPQEGIKFTFLDEAVVHEDSEMIIQDGTQMRRKLTLSDGSSPLVSRSALSLQKNCEGFICTYIYTEREREWWTAGVKWAAGTTASSKEDTRSSFGFFHRGRPAPATCVAPSDRFRDPPWLDFVLHGPVDVSRRTRAGRPFQLHFPRDDHCQVKVFLLGTTSVIILWPWEQVWD